MKIRGLINYAEPFVAAATLLSISLFIAACLASYTAYKIKTSNNTIEVTGSAKETVTADYGRWTIDINTKTSTTDQQSGFDRLQSASTVIRNYLTQQGFTDVEITSPSVYAEYIYPEKSSPVLTGYIVSRQVIVRSKDVEKISQQSGNIAALTGPSYGVTTTGIEYTYQKLSEKRIKLLSEATKDARARAEAIVKETGGKVGALKSASGGVVQVLPEGGVDISDYGMYDTVSRSKDIMITVHASFVLQ